MTEQDEKDEGKTFDMYHFFSRKDVWLAAAVVLLLLVMALMSNMFGPHAT